MLLNRGINLGGYLSQCCHEETHYDTFIQEDDIKQIAEWGCDHVRLPIDYNVLESDDGIVKEEGFERVRRVIDWCKKYELNVVLDLHKAYGYDFNDAGDEERNNLFASEELQKRFVDLWIEIVNHFGMDENVAFELLNEVVEKENADAWNKLIRMTVDEIRKKNATAPIIYGGIQWNSVKTLKLLDIPKDENIIFTFHFYEPLLFTHQKAYWVPNMPMDKTIEYPATMEYYKAVSKILGYKGKDVVVSEAKEMGKPFLREMIQEAVEKANEAGVKLYCGEFGVIDRAPVEDTYRWFEDIFAVFRDYDIHCAVWSYKEMDYGITGEHYAPIADKLFNLMTSK